ncbi:hypothetical protein F4820DRAFT_222337 [Hypoxylon rubiginosum]|uniref:Uncharacterized protein n=1 Tax=Hypoxylon rubiginosum TaxID=110542 RepID=A0ACB9ZG47_9PEZI|nr:hypothetical protein F4820DRAFT_222337 [Hypoxylon rubiginosum]
MAVLRPSSGLVVARQFTMSSSNSTSADTSVPETTSSSPSSPSDTTTVSTPSSPSTDSPTTPAPTTTSSTTSIETTSTPSTTPPTTSETPTSTSTPPTSTTTPSDTPSSTPTSSTTTTAETSPSSTTTTTPSSSTTTPTPTPSSFVITTTQVSTNSDGGTEFVTVTSTQLTTNTPSASDPATSTDAAGNLITTGKSSSGSLGEGGKIAIAVVVPIAAVALLVIAGIFFWRKRKQRKDAEEERRKEVEDYSYNPNSDPTVPDVGSVGAGAAYEMKEDSSGYRGWGSTTLAGSTGRKASTTMSGGAAGVAYSDATSPTRGNFSDTRSGDGLVNDAPNSPPEGEILGAMGPSATDNRGNGSGDGNVHRGPSNASSSYSAAGRSDGSAENPGSYGGPAYLDQYGGNNPYADGAYGQQQAGGQPIIRDNPARRNTRIENTSHYPQQSAGISQNF